MTTTPHDITAHTAQGLLSQGPARDPLTVKGLCPSLHFAIYIYISCPEWGLGTVVLWLTVVLCKCS